jgi:Beta-lactamase
MGPAGTLKSFLTSTPPRRADGIVPAMEEFPSVVETFQGFGHADSSYCAQLAVHVKGERVLDLAQGMGKDSLLPVFSSSKGASAVVIALLVEREKLDLDAAVAYYWPEFAQRGKGAVKPH